MGVARLRLPEKIARSLTEGEIPSLDRPVRFVVLRGQRGSVRARTLDELQTQLDQPWTEEEVARFNRKRDEQRQASRAQADATASRRNRSAGCAIEVAGSGPGGASARPGGTAAEGTSAVDPDGRKGAGGGQEEGGESGSARVRNARVRERLMRGVRGANASSAGIACTTTATRFHAEHAGARRRDSARLRGQPGCRLSRASLWDRGWRGALRRRVAGRP